MRHGKKVNHLGRTSEHRKALLSNLAISLIAHKRINTTIAKAKALRKYIEPLVTKAKDNTTHSRRVVFSYLQNKEAVIELFGNISKEVGNRPGGYVRIIRTGFRKGDGAEMAMIEFVDFNNAGYSVSKTSESGAGKRKRTRRSGSGGKTTAATGAAVAAASAAVAEVEDEVENVVEEANEVVQAAAAETVDAVDATADEVADAAEEANEVVQAAAAETVDAGDATADEVADAAEEATDEEKKED
jgi:large subunit ribosomal protein L17